jgi:hypothetical protein
VGFEHDEHLQSRSSPMVGVRRATQHPRLFGADSRGGPWRRCGFERVEAYTSHSRDGQRRVVLMQRRILIHALSLAVTS